MEATTSAEALRRQRAALGGSATTRAATTLNAEQASKRVTRKPTRRNRGRLPAVGKRATRAPTGSAGVMAAARVEEGIGRNTGPCRWRGINR